MIQNFNINDKDLLNNTLRNNSNSIIDSMDLSVSKGGAENLTGLCAQPSEDSLKGVGPSFPSISLRMFRFALTIKK